MARRTVSFIVAVSVDEDTMRLREDDDPASWDDLRATLTVALETIALDNLDGLAARVNVAAGSDGILYGDPSQVAPYDQDDDLVRHAAPGCTDDEQVG